MARILVVDDDFVLTRLVRLVLTTAGHEVQSARDGIDALELLEDGSPDLILLDMNMPRLDGRGFFLAARERGIRVPIIVFSAYDAKRDHDRLGADAYVQKPFDPDYLLQVINRVLAMASARCPTATSDNGPFEEDLLL